MVRSLKRDSGNTRNTNRAICENKPKYTGTKDLQPPCIADADSDGRAGGSSGDVKLYKS